MSAVTLRRIGLTGGIGSGKSTVASLLAKLGATLIDTDAIARSLTLPGGDAITTIGANFGLAAIDAQGGMDRARMRELVFNDATAKGRLESILHPLISMEVDRQAEGATGRLIVFDVPLLVESGQRWRARVNRVLVVDCSEPTQIARVVQRSGWSPAAVQAVISQQAGRVARRAAADALIWNDEVALPALAQEVQALWDCWA